MSRDIEIPWGELERLLARDPARRGLAAFEAPAANPWRGSLEKAAESLARDSTTVAIVTGFPVFGPAGVAVETDGPPGALFLARALEAIGLEVALISDCVGVPALEAGCRLWQLPSDMIHVFPFESDDPTSMARQSNEPEHCQRSDAWSREFLDSPLGRRLTHLVAIERPGPNHTLDSLAIQRRDAATPQAEFEPEVPRESRNHCHSMRGEMIDAQTAKTHRLFELTAALRPDVRTIGVADGGNEIGLGAVPWEQIRAVLPVGASSKMICRIPVDHLIVAGVSNWGGYALAAAVCALVGRRELLAPWDIEAQRELIGVLVRTAGAVDGVTRLAEATVDGLPLETYLQTLAGIRRLFGFEP